jgi:hypothetical protein
MMSARKPEGSFPSPAVGVPFSMVVFLGCKWLGVGGYFSEISSINGVACLNEAAAVYLRFLGDMRERPH